MDILLRTLVRGELPPNPPVAPPAVDLALIKAAVTALVLPQVGPAEGVGQGQVTQPFAAADAKCGWAFQDVDEKPRRGVGLGAIVHGGKACLRCRAPTPSPVSSPVPALRPPKTVRAGYLTFTNRSLPLFYRVRQGWTLLP